MTRHLPIDQSSKYPFRLDEILNGTQDFRWRPWRDDWYSGVLKGNLIHLRQVGDVLEYTSSLDTDLNDLLFSYFRLDDCIEEIYDTISSCDDHIAKLVERRGGLRILRQPDPWECMVAYICSSIAGPPTISRRVEEIAGQLGKPLALDGEERRTFPEPQKVLDAGKEQLEQMGLGFKRVPPAIIAAAGFIYHGDLDWEALTRMPYGEARLELMGYDCIGPKVADCIGLFALNKMKAFPVDSRVRKAVISLYFPWLHKQSDESIAVWAQDRFGQYAGYVNQFLYMG